VRQEIGEQNKAKIARGEQLVYKPFKVLDFIDKTGEKHGLAQSSFTTHWTLI